MRIPLRTALCLVAAGAIAVSLRWCASGPRGRDPGRSLAPGAPMAVARAAPERVAGTRVRWTGRVVEARPGRFVLALDGASAVASLAEGQPTPPRGSTVEVAGPISGRTALGVVLLEGVTLRVIASIRPRQGSTFDVRELDPGIAPDRKLPPDLVESLKGTLRLRRSAR